MDIVYIYKNTGSNSWNQELRYSLRSIDKYLYGVFNVTIIGDEPDWDFKNINYIPFKTNFQHDNKEIVKNHDISSKIFKATELFDKFILFLDDHYLLKPTTIDYLKINTIIEDLNKIKRPNNSRFWVKQLWKTFDRCKELGLYGWNYETHIPRFIDSDIARSAFSLFNLYEDELFFTAYGNLEYYQNKVLPSKFSKTGFYSKNQKIPENIDTVFLNHNDSGLSKELIYFIQNRFPKKSIFE